jgi:acetyl-CoA carboxylase alpha subunit
VSEIFYGVAFPPKTLERLSAMTKDAEHRRLQVRPERTPAVRTAPARTPRRAVAMSAREREDDQRAEIFRNLGLAPPSSWRSPGLALAMARTVAQLCVENPQADEIIRRLLPAESWKGPGGY